MADGTCHHRSRRAASVNRVITIDSINTIPHSRLTNANQLLPVAELFNDDDIIQLPQQPTPPQLEDKLEAIMQAITTIMTRLDDNINTRFDTIIGKLDDAINNAIISKINDVVTEVTDRVLPLIADQVTTQVSTVIYSHIAELRQNHHNMDNSISTYKQQIDGDLTTLRASIKSITDVQDQVNDIITHVHILQQALHDGGLLSVVDDNNSNGTGNNNGDNNSNDTSNNNNTKSTNNDNNRIINNIDVDSNNINVDSNDIDVESPTTPRTLDEYASTPTPASRPIQAHTTGQLINRITNNDSDEHTAEERTGQDRTAEIRIGHTQNNSHTNNISDTNN
jgi:hypothetical protein